MNKSLFGAKNPSSSVLVNYRLIFLQLIFNSYFCFVRQHVRIYLLGMIALFFISTTGITVYKHHCSQGGDFYGVFLDVSDNCEPKNTVEDGHECCSSGSSESDFQFTEECCTSDVNLYQINTDLINFDTKVEFFKVFISAFSTPVIPAFSDYKKTLITNKSPPILTTSERLSLFQIYLI